MESHNSVFPSPKLLTLPFPPGLCSHRPGRKECQPFKGFSCPAQFVGSTKWKLETEGASLCSIGSAKSLDLKVRD